MVLNKTYMGNRMIELGPLQDSQQDILFQRASSTDCNLTTVTARESLEDLRHPASDGNDNDECHSHQQEMQISWRYDHCKQDAYKGSFSSCEQLRDITSNLGCLIDNRKCGDSSRAAVDVSSSFCARKRNRFTLPSPPMEPSSVGTSEREESAEVVIQDSSASCETHLLSSNFGTPHGSCDQVSAQSRAEETTSGEARKKRLTVKFSESPTKTNESPLRLSFLKNETRKSEPIFPDELEADDGTGFPSFDAAIREVEHLSDAPVDLGYDLTLVGSLFLASPRSCHSSSSRGASSEYTAQTPVFSPFIYAEVEAVGGDTTKRAHGVRTGTFSLEDETSISDGIANKPQATEDDNEELVPVEDHPPEMMSDTNDVSSESCQLRLSDSPCSLNLSIPGIPNRAKQIMDEIEDEELHGKVDDSAVVYQYDENKEWSAEKVKFDLNIIYHEYEKFDSEDLDTTLDPGFRDDNDEFDDETSDETQMSGIKADPDVLFIPMIPNRRLVGAGCEKFERANFPSRIFDKWSGSAGSSEPLETEVRTLNDELPASGEPPPGTASGAEAKRVDCKQPVREVYS